MNKNVVALYECVKGKIMEEFGISEQLMFGSNDAECVQARTVLVVELHQRGLSDKEIAECTHKLRRCSICQIRNKYKSGNAPWTVKACLAHLKAVAL